MKQKVVFILVMSLLTSVSMFGQSSFDVSGTVVDKATVSGDSLVYNAAAYRVPEGSTLEALVKLLPGAKVEKHGTIKINGKTVSKRKDHGFYGLNGLGYW